MKGKVVIIMVLLVLIWSGSLAVLAQPGLSPADGPQRASSRDGHGALHGPARRQGGSLERWPLSRRAHLNSPIPVKGGNELSNPGRETGMTTSGSRRDGHGCLHGPARRQGGSLERWPLRRRPHPNSSILGKDGDI
jgi:hypothetical protein